MPFTTPVVYMISWSRETQHFPTKTNPLDFHTADIINWKSSGYLREEQTTIKEKKALQWIWSIPRSEVMHCECENNAQIGRNGRLVRYRFVWTSHWANGVWEKTLGEIQIDSSRESR